MHTASKRASNPKQPKPSTTDSHYSSGTSQYIQQASKLASNPNPQLPTLTTAVARLSTYSKKTSKQTTQTLNYRLLLQQWHVSVHTASKQESKQASNPNPQLPTLNIPVAYLSAYSKQAIKQPKPLTTGFYYSSGTSQCIQEASKKASKQATQTLNYRLLLQQWHVSVHTASKQESKQAGKQPKPSTTDSYYSSGMPQYTQQANKKASKLASNPNPQLPTHSTAVACLSTYSKQAAQTLKYRLLLQQWHVSVHTASKQESKQASKQLKPSNTDSYYSSGISQCIQQASEQATQSKRASNPKQPKPSATDSYYSSGMSQCIQQQNPTRHGPCVPCPPLQKKRPLSPAGKIIDNLT